MLESSNFGSKISPVRTHGGAIAMIQTTSESREKPLSRMTLAELQGFAQSLASSGLAPISRARTLAAVKSLFGFCVRMRYLAVNPAAELALPAYENRLAERILAEEDVRRVLAAETEPRNRVLLRLLYTGGLRVSEACHLLWRNLHARGDAGKITVFGKNGRTRAIPLPAEVWGELMGRRGAAKPEEPVFRSRSGKALDRGRVRVILRRAAERAGVVGGVSPALAAPRARFARPRSRRA
jgi:integrase/recombinase XerD